MIPTLTFGDPVELLPTVAGKSPGVVWHAPPLVTVQCAVCMRTATGKTIFAVNWANFAPDGAEGERHGLHERGGPPLSYRRCLECQAAKRHPNNQELP